MFAIITTEEYKELVQTQQENAELLDAVKCAGIELEQVKADLKELLLMLTKGNEATEYNDAIYSFEIVTNDVIAKYISENYFKKGKVIFKRRIECNE